MRSLAEELALADPDVRARVLDGLDPETLRHLLTDWHFLRRPDQALPKGPWRTVLVMAGRGWGKSRFGAESINELVAEHDYRRVGLMRAVACVMLTAASPPLLWSTTPSNPLPWYRS